MEQLLTVYKCFCDETRLRILNLLQVSPLCVCHLQHLLEVSQVNVSRHLAYLRKHGMVETTRHQNWTIYAIPETASVELNRNLSCLQDLIQEEETFRKDRSALNDLLQERDVRDVLEGGGCSIPSSQTLSPPL